ncbi:NADH-dependent phenylglyoxylate dehydrogenase subunit alpha [Sporomusa silvacetica DSM 10669]|uniref:NADH-dependent phenylglyoxylate dehydrogenase subunit alpha n=1 Tax=Sporomusa silvacetica DSM 10669 TaxID=1123289 RepID=A0ABZ3IUZ8_9FIRM|nr:transketolase C-terminal domain-containing protein [Sporomusa silvacetica]OZC14269.1 NADH-dependent phenylglyoxylate dehydrogenase subunit alpha [Sporomusa silvacetica DSM 10669]
MNQVMATTGNTCAALGAALAKPAVVAAYPITPQTSVVEYLAKMVADGKLCSRMIEVESEHSSMSVVQGAAMAGGRTFTATSAQGLALMFEPYLRMSTLRLPMVMAIAGREMTSPETIWGGQQDSISVRDAGWMQVYVENNQEILDMIIQGYKIAETQNVLLPINVCYDGFYLSHLVERVEIPSQASVDAFLPPYKQTHVILDPQKPMAVDPLTPGDILWKYRQNHLQAMQNALEVIDQVDREFAAAFGRQYGGVIEEYRSEDAEIVLVAMGSMVGTAKEAVDIKRSEGIKVGLVKVRFMRPFPTQKVRQALQGKKAFAVVDRNVCFGWNTGALYQEVLAAVGNRGYKMSSMPVIGGLGGADITLRHFLDCIDSLEAAKDQEREYDTLWLTK